MKVIKYISIIFCGVFLIFNTANAVKAADAASLYSFKTYALFEEAEVQEFLANPSVEWLELNSSHIQEYVREDNKDYYYVHTAHNTRTLKINGGGRVLYDTDSFHFGALKIYSEDDFMKWTGMDNVNKWIKSLGFDQEFDDYAIINTPQSYPCMVFLKTENDEPYILSLTFYMEQELTDAEINSPDDINVSQYEQYELLKLNDFREKYDRGYQNFQVKLEYISIDGKDLKNDFAVIYTPNEDNGYIEVNDIECVFVERGISISVNDNNVNIYDKTNETINNSDRKIPISKVFTPNIYEAYYRGNKYKVLGYTVNERCYLNIHDISVILSVDMTVHDRINLS